MNRRIKMLGLFAGAALCGAAAQAELATGDAAPEFTLKDSTGKEHSLSSYQGKHVVLEWINYACPSVEKNYDNGNMQKLQKDYGWKENVVWLAVCSSAPETEGNFSAEEINAMNHQKGFSAHAYLIDEDGAAAKAYGAKTTPHMFVIDPEGKLVYEGAVDGATDADAGNYISACLDACLKGEAPAVTTTDPRGCDIKS